MNNIFEGLYTTEKVELSKRNIVDTSALVVLCDKNEYKKMDCVEVNGKRYTSCFYYLEKENEKQCIVLVKDIKLNDGDKIKVSFYDKRRKPIFENNSKEIEVKQIDDSYILKRLRWYSNPSYLCNPDEDDTPDPVSLRCAGNNDTPVCGQFLIFYGDKKIEKCPKCGLEYTIDDEYIEAMNK